MFFYFVAILATIFFILNYTTLGISALFLAVVKYLHNIGFFTSIKFYKGSFAKSEIYYLKFPDGNNNMENEFKKIENILKKFNSDLSIFSLICIYYNKNENTPVYDAKEKAPTIIGIKKEILEDLRKTNNDEDLKSNNIEEYLKEEGFLHAKLPNMMSLKSFFPCKTQFSITMGINRFNETLKKSIGDENFMKMNSVKEVPKFVVHNFRNNDINFYVPLKSNEKFMNLINSTN